MGVVGEHLHLTGVRRRKIAQLVEARGSVAVRDLCEHFSMSEATIRRDLRELGKRGLVTRTHGGVMMNARVMADLPNEERMNVAQNEKSRIGQAAIDMLNGDEVVFLDAGTTALAAADNAHRKPLCRYVTTCLDIARRLASKDIQSFYMIGGSYQRVNDSFAGTLAVAALRCLSFDIAFLCCSAVDLDRRTIALGDEAYSQVQREAIAVSRRNVVLAHNEKFSTNAFICTATFDELDGCITDSGLDDERALQLKHSGLEVVWV